MPLRRLSRRRINNLRNCLEKAGGVCLDGRIEFWTVAMFRFID
ncbi:MAG: hypothetical protein PHV34_21945 [Verrucomicrobiae bacterium]|nr:hypothetical protein [Verrucomicrobiae bacterium]